MDRPESINYKPIEPVPRYPLELTEKLHICLWHETSTYKWTLAYFQKGKEGYYLCFVGNRPFDPRVNRKHFWELAQFGQTVADVRWNDEKEKEKVNDIDD